MGPVVSIIIPVYNVEAYIEECLHSVSNQTIPELLECLVVDDCGCDNSADIAKRYIESYTGKVKFQLVKREKNGGLSAARNSGLRKATGKYVYFLDSDDYIKPGAMETLLRLVNIYGDVDLIPALYITEGNRDMSQFNKHSFPEFSDNQYLIKRSLLDYDCIPVTAANRLIRRELLIENNLWFKEGIIHEDNYWTFFLAKFVKKMAFCSEKIYYYRTTPGSITNKINKEKEIAAFSTMINDFSHHIDNFYKGVQKKYIFLHLMIMWHNEYFHDIDEMKTVYRKFSTQCSLPEKVLMFLCVKTKGYLYAKFLNLLQRFFLLTK